MKPWLACALLVGGLLGRSTPARADDGFRCGSELVRLGETGQEVLRKCGPPTDTKRIDQTYRTKSGHARVILDIWTYDRGSCDFVRVLTFEGGALRAIEVGPYGK
jgi:hypothetical protein